MFQDAAALTIRLTVSIPKMFQPFPGSLYSSLLIAFPRATEQKHDCSMDFCEIHSKSNTACQPHFVQTASQRGTVSHVVVFFNRT